MCSSRCLKDTCSRMELDWSLIGFYGALWVFMVVVGALMNSGGSLCLLTWWDPDEGSRGLRYVFNAFLLVFWWGSSGMPFGHCLRQLLVLILVLGGLR